MVQQAPELDDPNRWNSIKRKANETRAAQAFDLFRANHIEPILIKGVAAGLYYPDDHFRDAIDLDLAVAPQAFEQAQELVATKEAAALGIDLHAGMRHLDPLDWPDLLANSRTVPMSQGSIRVLSPEDHLRILCVHWLTDGGNNRERLWDITYAIKNRPDSFDWHRFLDQVDRTRRRWLECVVAISRSTHGLDLTGTPLENVTLPEWVLATVEAEWDSRMPFRPLRDSLDSWSSFFGQFRKRIPPNPITATILMSGSLDAPTRIHYQLATLFARMVPSVRMVAVALSTKIRTRRKRAA